MTDCLFCQIVTGKIPSYTVYENKEVLAFLDIYPDSRYHTIVIPKQHSCNIYDIQEKDLHAIMSACKKITTLYKDKVGIEDVQIHSNNGPYAQQEILHSHWHIIPRGANDGLDITRTSHPERQEDFKNMLEKLN